MLLDGLGSVLDVFISVWLLSGKAAVWAALVRRSQRCANNESGVFGGGVSGVFWGVNWSRLCVCERESVRTYRVVS